MKVPTGMERFDGRYRAALIDRFPGRLFFAGCLVTASPTPWPLRAGVGLYICACYAAPTLDGAHTALLSWEALSDSWATRKDRRLERRRALRETPGVP